MKNNQALIENFLEAKFGEEGLSENTILALLAQDRQSHCPKLSQLVKWRPYCKLQKIMEGLNMSGLEIDV